jgi:catechol 2,3-dioxygenase-like lactoylglutathione lyase family enzyme
VIRDLSFVALAVRDLDKAIGTYRDMFGLELLDRGQNDELHADYAYLSLGNSCLQLLSPTEGNTDLEEFLQPWGEGAYLIALEVDDLDAALRHLAAEGVEPSRSVAMPNDVRVAWIPAAHVHGVQVALLEVPPGRDIVPPLQPGSAGRVQRLALHCIIVNDLQKAVADWERLFRVKATRWDEGEELGNKHAIIPLGAKGAGLEVMTPRTGDEPWAKLLRERGETTFLVGLDVEDMDSLVAHIRSTGRRVVGEHTAEDGSKMAMVHPMDAHGVMIELMQAAPTGSAAV